MEGRGGCCIARYGGGDAVASKVGRIMLRFRPIAPKPMAAAAAPKAEALESGKGRRRRRRRRSSSSSSGSGERGRRGRKKRAVSAVALEDEDEVGSKERERGRDQPDPITLPLMPETPERREAPSPPSDLVMSYVPPPWYGRRQPQQQGQNLLAPTPLRPSGSLVTVECVTDACVEDNAGLLWCGEEAARARLKADRWPAFSSDAYERVTWTNSAYKKMVGRGGGEEEEEEEGASSPCGGVRVALVTSGKMPPGDVAAFACRVRVNYVCRRERGTLAAQCDVYRLVGGGFCWKLDIDTALSLRL